MIKSINRLKFNLVDVFRKTESLKLYEEFLKTQWLKEKKIYQMQWQKLKALINHAYNNVPYYHKLFDSNGLHPNNLKTLDDFRRIPILTKDIIRGNYDDMLAKNKEVLQLYKRETGGSTGHPLIFYTDKKSRSAQWANMYRQWHIAGWEPGDRVVYLGGSSIYPSLHAVKKWFYVKLNNWLLLSAFDMSDKNMKQWVNKIRSFKARFMHAYASSAYLFAKFLEVQGIKDISFNAVITSAETLYPRYRATIERVFSCEVFNLYGAVDGGGFAFECEEHSGLHRAFENSFIEIIKENGDVAGEGESGEIISTDLYNHAMPFIRYRVGDVATVNSIHCKCGRVLPLLNNVIGRSADSAMTKNGARVHATYFDYVLRGINWISQFQVVQESENELSIFIKPDTRPSDRQIRWIKDVFRRKFDGMDVEVSLTDSIAATKGGKFNYIINKVNT